MATDVRLGTTLAGYRLELLLGRGGMGAVYLAEELALGRKVALKLLAPELAQDERFRERFLAESRLAASLAHPAIVPIHAAGESEGSLYIAMRYVEGSDLRKVLAAGPLERTRALRILSQVASALDAAHRRGLVHRDVKPANVLLDKEDNAYLTDFGLTKQASSQSGLTQTGQLVGTLDYVAPEQVEGGKVDGRADVYALGCLLYECVTGRKPFARESELATLWAHVHDAPPTTGEPELDAVLQKAMAKNPAERYGSAGELVAAARQALGVTTGEIVRPRVRRRPSRKVLALAAAALLALTAGAVALALALSGGSSVKVLPNSVAVIDLKSGKVVDDVSNVGSSPGPIAAGDGAVWVGDTVDGTVTRIDAKTRAVRSIALPQGAVATGIAASGGLVWVVSGTNQKGDLYKIATRSGTVTTTHLPAVTLPRGFGARAVAASRNDVWVANLDAHALKIDPATGKIADKKPFSGGFAPGITIAPDASVWIGSKEASEVGHIDATGAVLKPFQVGLGPSDIAAGGGSIWVASGGADTVTRIRPVGNTFQPTTIPHVGRHPLGIAVAGGAVWVANGRDGTVAKIDPATDAVVRTIRLGHSPAGIAAADGSLWVTVHADPLGTQTGTASDVLRVEFPALELFDSLDPALAYTNNAWQLEQATCLRLMNYPDKPAPAGSPVVPDAARAYPRVSNGGRTYTFTIRKGFRFSPPSNEPVTAETFRSTIERALGPAMNSPVVGLGYVNDIVGAKAYELGKASSINGISVKRDRISFLLVKPDPSFPVRISLPFFCAVPTRTPAAAAGLSEVPMAGPYYVASHHVASETPGVDVFLKRNPNYRGSRPHNFRVIDYALDSVNFQEPTADVADGRADYTFQDGLDASALARLRARFSGRRARGAQLAVRPRVVVVVLALNTHRPLFARARLRRAVSFAIDRKALARTEISGGAPTDQYLTPGMPGFRDARIYPATPDVGKARALAGLKRRRRAVLYTGNVPPFPQQAEILRKDLARIRIDVEVKQFANPYAAISRPGAQFDIGYWNWGPDYPDPSAMLDPLFAGSAPTANANASRFNDPLYNGKLAAAARLSGAARYRAYGKLDTDIARNAVPLVPFGIPERAELFSARVGCRFYQVGIGATDLAALCLSKK